MATPVKNIREELRRSTPVFAPDEQLDALTALLKRLRNERDVQDRPYKLVGPEGDETELPASIFPFLERVIEVLARGDALALVAVGTELTTQQAADILNVSRQYLVRLLDEDRIPSRRVGTHRRVRMEDVLAFKQGRDAQRRKALQELTRMGQEFGDYAELDDDEEPGGTKE